MRTAKKIELTAGESADLRVRLGCPNEPYPQMWEIRDEDGIAARVFREDLVDLCLEQFSQKERGRFQACTEAPITDAVRERLNSRGQEFKSLVERMIHLGRVTDVFKKQSFYGKPPKEKAFEFSENPYVPHVAGFGAEGENPATSLPKTEEQKEVERRYLEQAVLVHMMVGKMTEVGEMLERLYAYIFKGEDLDIVGIKEEVGDDDFYTAGICRTLGVTLMDIQYANVEKLKERFPDNFTEDAANNRNLEKERELLEKHLG